MGRWQSAEYIYLNHKKVRLVEKVYTGSEAMKRWHICVGCGKTLDNYNENLSDEKKDSCCWAAMVELAMIRLTGDEVMTIFSS